VRSSQLRSASLAFVGSGNESWAKDSTRTRPVRLAHGKQLRRTPADVLPDHQDSMTCIPEARVLLP
jgi:hypothetical protein